MTREPLDPEALRRTLAGAGRDLIVGRRIEWHARIDSTNLRARALAASGEPEGTVVLAGEQTAGRGRGNRAWHSAGGAGLYLSAILRPQAAPAAVPLFGLMAALAAQEALRILGADAVSIKWPNDLLVGSGHTLAGRKLAGILTEARTFSDGIRDLVIGIGVNTGQTAADFPPELRAIATSLRELTGAGPPAPEPVAAAVILALDRWYRLWRRDGDAAVLAAYEASAPGLTGRRVRVEGGPAWTGTTAGLTADGALRIRRDGAPERIETIRCGDMIRIEEA